MGSYRSYMRSDYEPEKTSILIWLICSLVAGYIVQNVLLRLLGDYPSIYSDFSGAMYLSIRGLHGFRIWTLVSYAFFHDPENLLHLLFSILGLYFIGRELETVLGRRLFLAAFLVSVLGGGILWSVVHWSTGGALLGASAGVLGLFMLFVCMYPDRPITFLLLFFPITLPKAKYLGYAIGFLELFSFVFFELFGHTAAIAYSAHIGGMLAALAFYRVMVSPVPLRIPWPKPASSAIPPEWVKKAAKAAPPGKTHFTVNLTGRDQLKAEVDRILDKINSKGFASLTPEEKKTLDDAKDLLSRN